jgi:large subunit ribosomal protein L31
MKPTIHPQFNLTATVTCACGNTFKTGSTAESLHTEVCSQCHPFYTGKQKLLDAAGSIDKFKKRSAAATAIKATVKVKKPRKVRTTKTAK